MSVEQAVDYEKNSHPGQDEWGEYFFENESLTYASAVVITEEEDAPTTR